MHEAFYLDGKSLSDVESIKSIAKSYGLPADDIAEKFIRISAQGKYHPDFYEAKKFGVTSFPTLLVEINGKYYDLKGSAITLNDLERNLSVIKEKGGIIGNETNTPNACNINGTGC